MRLKGSGIRESFRDATWTQSSPCFDILQSNTFSPNKLQSWPATMCLFWPISSFVLAKLTLHVTHAQTGEWTLIFIWLLFMYVDQIPVHSRWKPGLLPLCPPVQPWPVHTINSRSSPLTSQTSPDNLACEFPLPYIQTPSFFLRLSKIFCPEPRFSLHPSSDLWPLGDWRGWRFKSTSRKRIWDPRLCTFLMSTLANSFELRDNFWPSHLQLWDE